MTGPLQSPAIGTLFRRAGALVRGNLELFVLLAALWTVLNTAMARPLQRKMAAFQAGIEGATDPQVVWPALADILPWLLALLAIGAILFGIFAVLWGRALALGRSTVFAPGFGRRVLDVVARYLAFIGYSLLLALATLLALLLLKAVNGLSATLLGAGVATGINMVLSVLLTLACFIAFFALVSAFLVAAAGAGLDRRLPLFSMTQELLRNRRGIIAAFVLLVLLAALAVFTIAIAFGAEPDAPQSLWQSLSSGFVGSCSNLFALAMGLVALDGRGGAADDPGPA